LADQLRRVGGFEAEEALSSEESLSRLQPAAVDAVLLDVARPDDEGAALLGRLRRLGVGCPVLMLVPAMGPGAGPATGFDSAEVAGVVGAAAVMTKPFRLGALIARLRALLRNAARGQSEAAIELGPYRFHPVARLLVAANGRQIRLTEKESAILLCLRRAGQAGVSREGLLDEVWGYQADLTTHTLETHVYRLRRKIAASGLLVTEAGGYRLAGSPSHEAAGPGSEQQS
jgi:DNA-binding response OmpR family regulator